MNTTHKPCAMCGQLLKPALGDDWDTLQPYGGGEMRFVFSFGSCQFDEALGGTEFVGIVCDACADKCVSRMEKRLHGISRSQQ